MSLSADNRQRSSPSNTIAETTTSAVPAATRALPVEPHPSFLGSVGGEVLKLQRQGMVWAMLGLALFFFAFVSGALTQADALKQHLARSPATFIFNLYDVYLTLFNTGMAVRLVPTACSGKQFPKDSTRGEPATQ